MIAESGKRKRICLTGNRETVKVIGLLLKSPGFICKEESEVKQEVNKEMRNVLVFNGRVYRVMNDDAAVYAFLHKGKTEVAEEILQEALKNGSAREI